MVLSAMVENKAEEGNKEPKGKLLFKWDGQGRSFGEAICTIDPKMVREWAMQWDGSGQKRIADGKGPEWGACLARYDKSMEASVTRGEQHESRVSRVVRPCSHCKDLGPHSEEIKNSWVILGRAFQHWLSAAGWSSVQTNKGRCRSLRRIWQ